MQSQEDLEAWHKAKDPWNYENDKEDAKRKKILLSEIPEKTYRHVLDIGCGQGFVTKDLPGERVTGVDVSQVAIQKAKALESPVLRFEQANVFDLPRRFQETFDLIIINGLMYPPYIGSSQSLIYLIVDRLLEEDGILISVHIQSWYKARFPFLLTKEYYYDYREYMHKLEVYVK